MYKCAPHLDEHNGIGTVYYEVGAFIILKVRLGGRLHIRGGRLLEGGVYWKIYGTFIFFNLLYFSLIFFNFL